MIIGHTAILDIITTIRRRPGRMEGWKDGTCRLDGECHVGRGSFGGSDKSRGIVRDC